MKDKALLEKAFDDMREWLSKNPENHAALLIAPTYVEEKGIACSMIFKGEDDILSVGFVSALEGNPQFKNFVYSCLKAYEEEKKSKKNYS